VVVYRNYRKIKLHTTFSGALALCRVFSLGQKRKKGELG
jgi:hypothetical protein